MRNRFYKFNLEKIPNVKKLYAVMLVLAMIFGMFNFSANKVNADSRPVLTYQSHVAFEGWMASVGEGKVAGTTGRSLRMEALIINLKHNNKSAVSYRTWVQGSGWQAWKNSGSVSGTTGKSKQLESIQIKLTGDIAKRFSIYYRVHVSYQGWSDFTSNGKSAGKAGSGHRIEAIEIKLVPKGASSGASNVGGSASNTAANIYSSTVGEAAVEEARRWCGRTPYVWGGTNLETGCDCGGFVYAVYSRIGIDYSYCIWNFAGNVDRIGTNIGTNPANARAGDIVVWDGHVGIATGPQTAIQCQCSTGATERDYNYMQEFFGDIKMIIRPNF